jgi:transposase
MIRKKIEADLEPWIADASASLIVSFASGIIRDRMAVRAAITSPWSNGQTEGQITKLKLVKRQMYGRGKIDLLQARLIGAAYSGEGGQAFHLKADSDSGRARTAIR